MDHTIKVKSVQENNQDSSEYRLFIRDEMILTLFTELPVLDDLNTYLSDFPTIPSSIPSPSTSSPSHNDQAFLDDLDKPIEFTKPIKAKRSAFPSPIVYNIEHKSPFEWQPPTTRKRQKYKGAFMRQDATRRQELTTMPLAQMTCTFKTWEGIYWDWYLYSVPIKNKIQEDRRAVQNTLRRLLVKDNFEETFRNVLDQFVSYRRTRRT
jgi:hypothetical protein